MEKTNLFKYDLPADCPGILIKEKMLQEGNYGIFYYRISRNCPAREKDFIPQLFLANFVSRKKKIEEENNFSKLCQMASGSILQNKKDAMNLMQKFKNIGKYLYKGVVCQKHGLVLVTPSSHYPTHCSFFSYIEIDEKKLFNQKVFQL